MKKIVYSVLLLMITIAAFSQPVTTVLPTTAAITHYKLSVGYNTTTVLIFPVPVKQADRGEKDLLAQKQPGVENVLKVKAARKDFPPTNLHVFTSDGRVYAFDISYAADPVQTTYDLAKMQAVSNTDDNPEDRIVLSNKPLDKELAKNIAKVKAAKPFFSAHSSKYEMKVQLQTIYRSGDILFLGLGVTNRSPLPYSIDLARLYIQDKNKIKRTSVQEREIIALNKDTIRSISAKSSIKWVVAIPLLTIPDHKKMVWVVHEKNGGRNLLLRIKNKHLLKVRNLE